MSTFRVVKRDRYTTIDRATLNDERLSFKARGILVWLLDKPDDWRCASDEIARAGLEGREAVRTALNELAEHGYLVRSRHRDPATGRISTVSTVYERPVTGAQESVAGSPDDGSPDDGISGPLLKTETKTVTEPVTTSPDMADPDGSAEWFEKFWRAWPRKVKRGSAERAFKAAMKRDGLDKIRPGVRAWRAWWTANRVPVSLIPYPATFLNGQQYLDDPVQVNATRSGARSSTIDHLTAIAAEEAGHAAAG